MKGPLVSLLILLKGGSDWSAVSVAEACCPSIPSFSGLSGTAGACRKQAGSPCEANKCLVWAFLSPLASVSPLEELKKSVQFHETVRRAEEQISLGAREPPTHPGLWQVSGWAAVDGEELCSSVGAPGAQPGRLLQRLSLERKHQPVNFSSG